MSDQNAELAAFIESLRKDNAELKGQLADLLTECRAIRSELMVLREDALLKHQGMRKIVKQWQKNGLPSKFLEVD